VSPEDDRWNRKILDLLERGDIAGLSREAPEFAREARADMGFKHLSWLLGGMGRRFYGAACMPTARSTEAARQWWNSSSDGHRCVSCPPTRCSICN
jgi:hypothetical protein